jgi:hypothetical protein
VNERLANTLLDELPPPEEENTPSEYVINMPTNETTPCPVNNCPYSTKK